ncbi:hypothetical protein D3C86_1756210 [compost metagenome]
MIQRQPADREAAFCQHARSKIGQPCKGNRVLFRIARADIGMHESRFRADESRSGLRYFADHQILLRRNRGGMCTHGPVESDDAAVGEQLSQVIEGAPVSKADFHKRPFTRQIEIGRDMVEDIPLRGQPANETIESAHFIRP